MIKNSYDARATRVDVSLENIQSKTASISIKDNGTGMSATDLENKWLNIATPNKSLLSLKKGERVQVGEKGIGRLSSESLGDLTVLETMARNETVGYRIEFDWRKYQDQNALLNEIQNPGVIFKKRKNETGTTLTISNLRHDWNDVESQKSLLKDILLLHPPNEKPAEFSVIPSGFSSADIKPIDKKFFKLAAYSLKVELIAGKILKYRAYCLGGQKKTDKLELATKLTCGDASFDMYYYYRTAGAYKTNIGVDVATDKVRAANEILDDYSGIKIYRDAFRVKPYGENGEDWLGLDVKFQDNTMYPRNTNVFGFVRIGKSSNPSILDTTTREGIVLNKEFQDLMRFIDTAIRQIFIDFRSGIESHKKKARKSQPKTTKKKTVAVAPKPQPTQPQDKLLKNFGNYPQHFYLQLEQEINDCYEKNFPNAAFFLSRKLIENLIFNILEKRYPSDIHLWYNTATNGHLKLSQLIKNLFDNRSEFKPNAQSYIEKFNIDVGSFRKEANSKAHNIFEYLSDKSEIRKFKIPDLVQLLLNIYNSL